MTKYMGKQYPTNTEYDKLLKEIAKNIKRLPKLRAMAEGSK